MFSSSDDERRLRQAEARAVKKIKASKPSPNFHPYKRSSYSLASNTTGNEGHQKFETAWGAQTQTRSLPSSLFVVSATTQLRSSVIPVVKEVTTG